MLFRKTPKHEIIREDIVLLVHRELANMQHRGIIGAVTRSKGDFVKVEGEISLTQIAEALLRMIKNGPPVNVPFGSRHTYS